MVVLEVIFLLSKILIDPSVVKVFPYYLFYMENICFFMSFYFTFTFILRQKGDLCSFH